MATEFWRLRKLTLPSIFEVEVRSKAFEVTASKHFKLVNR
jgi:hypothetical protein